MAPSLARAETPLQKGSPAWPGQARGALPPLQKAGRSGAAQEPPALVNRQQAASPETRRLPEREEPKIEFRTLQKKQREQSGSLERQDRALRNIAQQLSQQGEQLRQLAGRVQNGGPKLPSVRQMTDEIMREMQRQLRVERQRRGG